MKDANKIAFIISMAGITTTTLGHYLPDAMWAISYGVAILLGIVSSAIFE